MSSRATRVAVHPAMTPNATMSLNGGRCITTSSCSTGSRMYRPSRGNGDPRRRCRGCTGPRGAPRTRINPGSCAINRVVPWTDGRVRPRCAALWPHVCTPTANRNRPSRPGQRGAARLSHDECRPARNDVPDGGRHGIPPGPSGRPRGLSSPARAGFPKVTPRGKRLPRCLRSSDAPDSVRGARFTAGRLSVLSPP